MASIAASNSDNLAECGLAIYQQTLKTLLEPTQNGRFVAIHVDSADYEVARTSADAMRAILKYHPLDGRLVIRKIGDEPEYSLTTRLLLGEMQSDASLTHNSH